jgi:hypothetical protein
VVDVRLPVEATVRLPEVTILLCLGFKIKLNAYNMCVYKLNLYTYHTENKYKLINIIISYIYYMNNVL